MILTDTSVWVEYLRGREKTLEQLLKTNRVFIHPFVIGEVACGNVANREGVFSVLKSLPALPVISDYEVLRFIERNRLMGRGIGYIDFHLLTAVALTPPVRLWTNDRRLKGAAGALKLAYRPKE